MNDLKKLNEQYAEKHPGFKSYTECMSRALLTGLAAFGLTFSGTYFAQYLLQPKWPQKPKTQLIAPVILSSVAAWWITAHKTKTCQMAWMAAEDKNSYFSQQTDTSFSDPSFSSSLKSTPSSS